MDIKITISDTGVEISATGGQQITQSSEVVRSAATTGAIDAGPAPTAGGSTQPGAPSPFISGSTSGDVMTLPGISAGSSAAAAMPE
jgi:hypothetical protein